jgi:integrase/recombinase XerD
MRARSGVRQRKVRGKQTNTQLASMLDVVVRETTRLWRKHHLGYDQTKYVVEQARRRLTLQPPGKRRRTVNRLDKIEVERLIQNTYQTHSKYGLMIKTLFLSGARVDEVAADAGCLPPGGLAARGASDGGGGGAEAESPPQLVSVWRPGAGARAAAGRGG